MIVGRMKASILKSAHVTLSCTLYHFVNGRSSILMCAPNVFADAGALSVVEMDAIDSGTGSGADAKSAKSTCCKL